MELVEKTLSTVVHDNNATHRRNHYPVESIIKNQNDFPSDNDLPLELAPGARFSKAPLETFRAREAIKKSRTLRVESYPRILNIKRGSLHTKSFRRIHFSVFRSQTFQPPSHANLEVLKNKPRKTWRLGPQTWRLQKHTSNTKTATTDYLFESTLYLISALCCTLLLLFLHLGSFSSRECTCLGARDPQVVGRIAVARRHSRLETEPSIAAISLTAVMGTDFSIFLHTFRNCSAI